MMQLYQKMFLVPCHLAAYGIMYVTWEVEGVNLNKLKQKKELNPDFQFAEKEL